MKNIYLLLLALCLISCRGKNESIEVNRKIYADIINKEIGGTSDLVLLTAKNSSNAKYTFLTTLDADCNTCFQIMNDWEKFEFPRELKKVRKQFIVQGQLTDIFRRFLSELKSNDTEIYLDTAQSFLVKNKLASYYQKTLLLDSNRKVIYVGNPLDKGLVETDLMELVNE
ncbi:hypothetical protein VRU48_12855 [Pedobacter sp. KR3-3]|uniref:Thioredoxin-like fold domain-containing protein n=1 Tax=Pedobacter albus TaxID=3113905 RepID=A0ABU7I955_9SPHI|nr:hypothetical protein [Pedobacter sp. KR3-3]MEE1946003.1 hypothetical protein [Pedobacter sp. KR3-3]